MAIANHKSREFPINLNVGVSQDCKVLAFDRENKGAFIFVNCEDSDTPSEQYEVSFSVDGAVVARANDATSIESLNEAARETQKAMARANRMEAKEKQEAVEGYLGDATTATERAANALARANDAIASINANANAEESP